ncbi:hypothetical protein ACFFVB_12385 [Formosa undariae]|uniref:VCBS repeat-containing protein n=1 Tax=Formosa undariae TaxID=1325436 RepID=A0ABV5F358_9FLAO
MKIKFTYFFIGILYIIVLSWFFVNYQEDARMNLVFDEIIEDGDIIFRSTSSEKSELNDFKEFGIVKKSLWGYYVWDNKSTMKRSLSKWAEKGVYLKVYRIKPSGDAMVNFELHHGTYNHLLNSEALEFITEKRNPIPKQISELKEHRDVKPNHISNFIPEGYEIVYFENVPNSVKADLNKDGISDYVVLLSNGSRDIEYLDASSVKIAVLEGQKDGSFKLKGETGNLTYAFLYRNLNQKIKVSSTNVINVKHQSMRHDYELKFRYQKGSQDYMLIGTEYNNYGNAIQKGAGNTSINFISGKRMSTIGGNKTSILDDKFIRISEVDDNSIYELIN